jgi:hypothetical protein
MEEEAVIKSPKKKQNRERGDQEIAWKPREQFNYLPVGHCVGM